MSFGAVFLDRDGTINVDPGYLGDPEKVELYPDTGEALFDLKELNFKLIVISNQSGVARGLIDEEDVVKVNNKVNEILEKFNVKIDAFYFCPYHTEFNSEEECSCRKPSPEMVFKAAKENNIDLLKSFFIGDNVSDIECGKNAGLKTILVKTGYGKESFYILQKQNNFPTFVAENLIEAVNYIKNFRTGEN